MKKATLLAVHLVLVVSLAAYGDVDRRDLEQTAECATADGGIHATASGSLVLVSGPEDWTGVTIHLANAAPHYAYAVHRYVYPNQGDLLGIILTNENGVGTIHLNVDEDIYASPISIYNESNLRLLRAECLVPPCDGGGGTGI